MSAFMGFGLVAALLAAAGAVLVWKVLSSMQIRGVDPVWLKNFSVSSYRPMERLLNEDDIAFLKEQPGYEPGMEKRLRADRRRVFRMYLRDLGRDFNRLHLALRLMVLHAPEDSPELAKTLIRQKLYFVAGVLALHIKIEFYRFGIGSVDVRGLISTIEAMQQELSALAAPAAA